MFFNNLKCNFIWRILPYVTTAAAGALSCYFALLTKGLWHDLLVNLSATFFAVLALYFIYELTKAASDRKLNRKIHDHAKKLIDCKLIFFLPLIRSFIFPPGENIEDVNNFRKKPHESLFILDKEKIKNNLENNKFLGFIVFKSCHKEFMMFEDLLQNQFLITKLPDEETLILIEILENLKSIEIARFNQCLYIETEGYCDRYKVILADINEGYNNCALFDSDTTSAQCLAFDYGHIDAKHINKLLKYYKINRELSEQYAILLNNFLLSLKKWFQTTGFEFINNMEDICIQLR